jgi:hypothetical protein
MNWAPDGAVKTVPLMLGQLV